MSIEKCIVNPNGFLQIVEVNSECDAISTPLEINTPLSPSVPIEISKKLYNRFTGVLNETK